MSHKKASHTRQGISTRLRQAVWETHCGATFTALCYCCNVRNITVYEFHAAHIVADIHQGDAILENLRPVCSTCNLSCANKDLRQFAVDNGFTDGKLAQEANFKPFRQVQEDQQIERLKKENENLKKVNNYLTSLQSATKTELIPIRERIHCRQQLRENSIRKIIRSRYFH